MKLEQFVNHATDAFSLPDICLKLRELLQDSRSDASDIAKLISIDPALTAKVLKLANSALFRFPSQIDSITKAVSIIGGEALYNLVIAEVAKTAFISFDNEAMNISQHWQQSVHFGMLTKHLAKALRIRGTERFFVSGILCQLSDIVIAKYATDTYLDYKKDNSDALPWEKQVHYFGFEFSRCSGAIMQAWNLPEVLTFPVLNLHDSELHSSERDIALMYTALRVDLIKSEPEHYGDLPIFTPQVAKRLPLTKQDIDEATEFAAQESLSMASLI